MIDIAWWTVGWLIAASAIVFTYLTVRMVSIWLAEIGARWKRRRDRPAAWVVRRKR